jgi:hypothetical protein
LLKESLFRFFASHPAYTILNLSHAELKVPHEDFEKTLLEIQSDAGARGLHLVIARTAEEGAHSKQLVLKRALQKQVEVLQAKLDLREKIKSQAEQLLTENAKLKENVNRQVKELKTLHQNTNPLNPLFEKLWSEKDRT